MFNWIADSVKGDGMVRSLIVLLLSTLAIIQSSAHALGLGEMLTHSAINAPLRAEIKLLSIEDTPLRSIQVRLAQPDDFRQAGVARAPILDRLKFQVAKQSSNQAVIQVLSAQPINEPFLNFLIQVDWPNGRLLREYTALLDPPTTTDSKPPKIEPIASQVELTPVQATPAVVSAGGTVTRTDEYGPVKAKETLWSIAGRVRPKGVSMQQMMAALQRANPQAFIGGNMNRLRKGQILRVPDLDEILSISPAQAEAIFRQQLNSWSTPKNVRVASQLNQLPEEPKKSRNTQVAESENSPDAPTQGAQKVVPQVPDRLQIATARPDGEAEAGASEGRGNIQSNYELTEQLMRARENAETARQESNILRSEIDDLQARLGDMQRLLTLKDEQLAQLQDSVRQRQEDATKAQVIEVDERNASESGAVSSNSLPPEQDENQSLINPETVVNVDSDKSELPAPVLPKPDELAQPVDTNIDKQAHQQEAWWAGVMASVSTGIKSVTSQPLYLGGVGVVLLLLLLFLIIRRKRNEREVEEIALQDPFDPGYAASSMPSANEALDDNDPINQADLHIAYGRFQQAESALKQAQQAFPERMDIRYKLFEVYHATQNAAAFTALAQQMLNDNQHLDDPMAWADVTAMGGELAPDEPLFNPDSFDGPATSKEDNSNEIAFDLSDDASPAGYPSKQEPEVPPAFTQAQPVLDQPLDIESAFQSVINENAHTAQQTHEPAEPENEDVKNKLDLARVYIDMGDTGGARDILYEVQEEGSQRQKSQAADLLAQIS